MSNKLELTWYGKEKEISVEPRILIENIDLSHSNEPEPSLLEDDNATYDNILIHGDNLLALKALEQDYIGKVKCIYIDPPYNTGSAFENYDDNVEHSTWLSLMKPRLELLKKLLSENGSIHISIDDREYAYLKVLCDEIFGRENYVGDFIWQKKKGGSNDSKFIAVEHEYILNYVKNINKSDVWKIHFDEEYLKRYAFEDENGRYFWDTFARPGLKNPIIYDITAPDGTIIRNGWVRSKERFEKDYNDGAVRIIKKKDGEWSVQFKQYLGSGKRPRSILNDVATNSDGKKEMQNLFNDPKFFSYPKPENLIRNIIECNTAKGDLVLDSFLGSGTTAAVAHKMGRRWIGIEMGEQVYTHCKVRLDKVIDNKDTGGITKAVNWHGGGGYKFYELAPTLIKKDAFGEEIINPEYDGEMLSAAVAKHEGYFYNPDKEYYWKQAKSENNSYLYVTTRHVNKDMIEAIKQEMKDDEFLLIVCKSYDNYCNSDYQKSIAIKKIPQSLLKNCEFDVDNYNLNIVCPPEYKEEDDDE